MNRKAFRTAAVVATAAGATLGLSAAAQAAGVSGPAIYVNHVLYRTVATPTELSGTGAPAQSWDTIYNFFGAQPSVATAAPGDPGFNGGRWQVRLTPCLARSARHRAARPPATAPSRRSGRSAARSPRA